MDDWILWYQVIAGIIIVAVIGGIWLWRQRGGYFAVILKRVSGTYAKIISMRFDPTMETLRFSKRTFNVELENMGFRDDTGKLGGKFIYYFDYGSNKQLSFKEFKQKIDAEDLDLLVSRNIVSQLVARLGDVNKMSLLLMLLGLGLGIAIGFIIGQFVNIGSIMSTPVNATVTPTPIPPFITPGPVL